MPRKTSIHPIVESDAENLHLGPETGPVLGRSSGAELFFACAHSARVFSGHKRLSGSTLNMDLVPGSWFLVPGSDYEIGLGLVHV